MPGVSTLSLPIRLPVLGRYLGEIIQITALSGVVPASFAVAVGDYAHAGGHLAVVAVLGIGGWRLARIETTEPLREHEAISVVCLAFVSAAIAYSLPMLSSGIGLIDSLFEAVSGITTTGLSTLGSVSDKPRSLLFTAAWLQWLGGLGIIVLSVPLLFGQGIQARKLTSVLVSSDSFGGGVRHYARIALAIYVSATAVGFSVLWMLGANWFHALTLTMSAVSTGGYSPIDESLAQLTPAIQGTVIVFCVFGAIAFPLFRQMVSGDFRAVAKDGELRLLATLGIVLSVIIAHDLLQSSELTVIDAGIASVTTAFSAQTTAGFTTVPISDLDTTSRIAIIGAMATGGSMGSSAGGIKLLRVIVLFRVVQLFVLRSRMPPHAEASVRALGRTWSDAEVVKVLAMTVVFVVAAACFWILFVYWGYDAVDALFEVVSALGTVGMSTGITSPNLEPGLKLALCLAMLMGRLEILAFLVFLAPGSWIPRTRESA